MQLWRLTTSCLLDATCFLIAGAFPSTISNPLPCSERTSWIGLGQQRAAHGPAALACTDAMRDVGHSCGGRRSRDAACHCICRAAAGGQHAFGGSWSDGDSWSG